jgi:hypothetical protein
MSKMNFTRKGPPKPGSGLGHPFYGDRPFNPPETVADRRREKEDLAAEKAQREAALAPERARQARRDARNHLKDRLKKGGKSFGLFDEVAKIPEPPTKKL